MSERRTIWLVVNDASGSNDRTAREELERYCGDAGFSVARTINFPEQDLPDPAALGDARVDLVAVFTGDGTINALIETLSGWRGSVLVLPGGTKNLLYHRLHGMREMGEVIRLAATGDTVARRPGVIRCAEGIALAGLLAGPGTSWYDVREAMRDADVLGVADSAALAIGETLSAPAIVCREPRLGRREGYPLVMLTPHDHGIEVTGFHSETVGDYLSQGWALLTRNFRDGPHDTLGVVREVMLASTEDAPFGVMLDGEKAESPAQAVFSLVPCEVDLLATEADGR